LVQCNIADNWAALRFVWCVAKKHHAQVGGETWPYDRYGSKPETEHVFRFAPESGPPICDAGKRQIRRPAAGDLLLHSAGAFPRDVYHQAAIDLLAVVFPSERDMERKVQGEEGLANSVYETAHLLGVSKWPLHRAIKRGELLHIRSAKVSWSQSMSSMHSWD
jgi:hypothetical protein